MIIVGIVMIIMIMMLLLYHHMIIMIRSPRNFDAVLGLYRTNKLHLAAGVCVQVPQAFHMIFGDFIFKVRTSEL